MKRNAVVSLMNKARKEFYTNFIEENSCDQRKVFKASKSLLNCKPMLYHLILMRNNSQRI